ncbi:MAG: YkgJ family cysteine cluster protein [Nitrospirae bacterium]|nr:MAG: YkgJ family cysteine cluster protein [Nitrospirota bacterium]
MHNLKSDNRTPCKRCGTCCMKGGPALHKEDKKLLLAGHIKHEQLVTIRKGEPAYSPKSGKLELIKKEIVKISGKGKTWECLFYDKQKSSCRIYRHRPLECRLLECRDTARLISVIEKNTITRIDIVNSKEPICKFIRMHEAECSVQKAEDLISKLPGAKDKAGVMEKLSSLAKRDLEIRQKAVSELNLSLETELFYFGRPLFKILSSMGEL